jgi:hypothetical protein
MDRMGVDPTTPDLVDYFSALCLVAAVAFWL